jgi:hypothetical protein
MCRRNVVVIAPKEVEISKVAVPREKLTIKGIGARQLMAIFVHV